MTKMRAVIDTNVIVSNDRDLLALHPFSGIPIVTPKTYIEEWSAPDAKNRT